VIKELLIRLNNIGIIRILISLTPNRYQLRSISQNNRGGLWEYGTPFSSGTKNDSCVHISQATETYLVSSLGIIGRNHIAHMVMVIVSKNGNLRSLNI